MEKYLGLVGTRFERWTVLEVTGKKGGALHCRCLCDCGVSREVNVGSLRKGASTSCGCRAREVTAKLRLNDLTGSRFGKLNVLSRSENTIWNDAQWSCMCDCGISAVVRSCNLVSGNTGSCGCARISGEVVRPELARKKASARAMERYRSDSKFNINIKMAAAIRCSLRRKGAPRKVGRWAELVGYTVEQLRVRLVATLPTGFTWQSFLDGEMEIDHIIPLAAFNYQAEGDLDFKRAWAITNLRLIPALENQQKKDKLSGSFQPSLGF